MVGNTIINHLTYADDLVILCPYNAGLQQLLRVCSQYGSDFDIKYNSQKSNIMIARSTEDNKLSFLAFFLSGIVLNVAYNDGMRLLLKMPRWSSASQMFVSVDVSTCPAVLRNLMYRCTVCVG